VTGQITETDMPNATALPIPRGDEIESLKDPRRWDSMAKCSADVVSTRIAVMTPNSRRVKKDP
jgi:hypothetical protein